MLSSPAPAPRSLHPSLGPMAAAGQGPAISPRGGHSSEGAERLLGRCVPPPGGGEAACGPGPRWAVVRKGRLAAREAWLRPPPRRGWGSSGGPAALAGSSVGGPGQRLAVVRAGAETGAERNWLPCEPWQHSWPQAGGMPGVRPAEGRAGVIPGRRERASQWPELEGPGAEGWPGQQDKGRGSCR